MQKDTIAEVLKYNQKDYNYLKLAEELAELSEVIIKRHLKKPEFKPSMEKVIEEIGDVELRLTILKRMEGIGVQVKERIAKKSARLQHYMDEGLYKGGV